MPSESSKLQQIQSWPEYTPRKPLSKEFLMGIALSALDRSAQKMDLSGLASLVSSWEDFGLSLEDMELLYQVTREVQMEENGISLPPLDQLPRRSQGSGSDPLV